MNRCIKCKSEFQGNYCSHCGHPKEIERIDGRYVLSEMASVLNFQKGIFFTIKELLIRPGQSIRTFISEDRNRLVKPIMFILITSLIYTLFVQIFHFEDGYINYNFDDWQGSSLGVIFQWVSNHYGYSNIIMALFIVLWIQVFFKKYKHNFFEILILMCFIMGMCMLMFAFLGVLESITRIRIMDYAINLVFIYAFWAIGQFFDKTKLLNYLKALIAYFLGFVTFTLVIIGIGIFIDLIK